MTLLKKRMSKDITSSPSYAQQQAKKARMTNTAAIADSRTFAARISHARTAAAVAAADQFVYAQIMARVRMQQQQDILFPPSSSSRSTSPPRRPSDVALSQASTVVTPYALSPQDALSSGSDGAPESSSLPNPYSCPSLPFEKMGQRRQPAAPASAGACPLEMLSRVSSQVAGKTTIKTTRQPTSSNAPAPNKTRDATSPVVVKPSSSREQALTTTAAIAATIDEGNYVGQRNPTNNLRNGRGIMAYPNGCRYVGCFSNDKRHGYGKVWYPNGLGVYTGYWKHNKKDGRGIMHYANGDVYEGEWMGDRPNGTGTLTMKDKGEVYSGGFLEQKKHGRGLYKFANGDVYEGDWKGDVKHGNGLYMLAKGRGSCREVYYNGVEVRNRVGLGMEGEKMRGV